MMKYGLICLVFLFTMQQAQADVYTCTVSGKTVYQGKPCAGSKELSNKVAQSQNQIKEIQESAAKDRLERASRKEPKIGMTKAEAEKSTWGYPDKVNTTTTARNEFEQWIYRTPYSGSKYLHFTNGKITSISK